MAKGSGNLRGRTSDASKPYDVSNSFVKRVASRVTELLPQPSSWLSRWMSPSSLPNINDYSGHSTSSTITSRPPATSRAELNLVDTVDNHIPTKKARTGSYNSPSNQKQFLRNIHAEDLSPITVRGEPVAVPSCSKDHPEIIASTPAQAQNVNKVNGDDCSETSESTSGCSSLVPQAQSTTRSVGGSRYGRNVHPGMHNPDSLQRRGPSFSTTTFSSPLRTSMRERGSSPFYSGRTMYGGSSQAYLISALHSPQRRVGPTVKPIPAQQSLPLSSTAKRILDALEQFSTPVMDAKRMPVVGSKRKLEGSQRYTELSIPTTPDLLRVKRRERLQLSTSAARQTATTSLPPPASSTEYTIRQEEEDPCRKKHTGKVKTKEKIDEELPVEVKLPPAVLSLDNLPKIDIAIPPPPSSTQIYSLTATSGKFKFASPTPVSHSESLPVASNTPTKLKFSLPICESSSKTIVDNDLSKPVVLSDSLSSLRRTSVDNLTSHPKKRKSKDDSSSDNIISLTHDKELSCQNNLFVSLKPSSTTSVQPDNKITECKTCHKQLNNSQLSCSCYEAQNNNIKNDKIVGTTSPWVCSTCKKDNPSIMTICIYCQTKEQPKSLDTNKNHIKSPATGFGNLFKMPVGTWECSTCMIQNKSCATKCIACESAKPTENKKPTTTIESNTTTATTSIMANATVSSGFGNQFQKPSGSWDCESCLVVNKQDTSKCVACDASKPGLKAAAVPCSEASSVVKQGFGNLFKKPPGSWSCEVCMVSNSAEKVKCVACETVKPGTTLSKTTESSVQKFSFGIPTSSSDMSTAFSFGIPKVEPSVTKSNKTINLSESNSSSGCSQLVTTSQTFTFGIPKPESENTSGVTSNNSPSMSTVGSTLQSKPLESKTSIANLKKITSATLIESAKSELSSLTNAASVSVPKTVVSTVTNEKPALSDEKASITTPDFSFNTSKVAQNTNNKPSDINLALSSKSSQPFHGFGAKQGNLGSNVASSTTNTISLSSASNIFKFGETKTVSSGAGMSSISSVNTQSSFTAPKSSITFSFGSNNEKKEVAFGTSTIVENQQSSTVGATSSDSKPAFGLFTPAQNQTPVFGTNNAFASTNMGSKDQPPNLFTSSTGIDFGAAANKNSTTTNSFPGYGHPNIFPTASQENKPSAVYTFGSVSKGSPATGGFAFNPTVEKQAETSFGFPTAQNSPAPTKLFGFNNATSAPSSTFNFDSKQFTANISPFNAASDPPVPVFGAPGSQQPPPAFGEQTNPSPVFAFGSQSAQPSQTSSNPMFEFAPNQQQQSAPVVAAPSTTFVFGANPTPTPATPAFDPNVKPTYNFSQGSTPVFSAIPTINSTGPAPVQHRKIRKAVRRTNISSVRQT